MCTPTSTPTQESLALQQVKVIDSRRKAPSECLRSVWKNYFTKLATCARASHTSLCIGVVRFLPTSPAIDARDVAFGNTLRIQGCSQGKRRRRSSKCLCADVGCVVRVCICVCVRVCVFCARTRTPVSVRCVLVLPHTQAKPVPLSTKPEDKNKWKLDRQV